jgi:ATP-dependent RNA helicase DHX8/PRP22
LPQVFEAAPADTRKAVLATNIAETSLTIPGVRHVVDTGYVKARSYSAKLGVDALQVGWLCHTSLTHTHTFT